MTLHVFSVLSPARTCRNTWHTRAGRHEQFSLPSNKTKENADDTRNDSRVGLLTAMVGTRPSPTPRDRTLPTRNTPNQSNRSRSHDTDLSALHRALHGQAFTGI